MTWKELTEMSSDKEKSEIIRGYEIVKEMEEERRKEMESYEWISVTEFLPVELVDVVFLDGDHILEGNHIDVGYAYYNAGRIVGSDEWDLWDKVPVTVVPEGDVSWYSVDCEGKCRLAENVTHWAFFKSQNDLRNMQ